MQLTKAYVAKRPTISWFCYIRTVYAHQDHFTSCQNVAMSLYNIIDQNTSWYGALGVSSHAHLHNCMCEKHSPQAYQCRCSLGAEPASMAVALRASWAQSTSETHSPFPPTEYQGSSTTTTVRHLQGECSWVSADYLQQLRDHWWSGHISRVWN